MDLNTKDMLKKKILDSQESVRDYQMFSKKVNDSEVDSTFKQFSKESAMQARKLKQLLDNYEG